MSLASTNVFPQANTANLTNKVDAKCNEDLVNVWQEVAPTERNFPLQISIFQQRWKTFVVVFHDLTDGWLTSDRTTMKLEKQAGFSPCLNLSFSISFSPLFWWGPKSFAFNLFSHLWLFFLLLHLPEPWRASARLWPDIISIRENKEIFNFSISQTILIDTLIILRANVFI